MSIDTTAKPTIAQYAADVWEHVCPLIRVAEPARQAGWTVLRGNEWTQGQMKAYPERVEQAGLVVIQRDFPRHTAAYEAVIETARRLGRPVLYELDDLLLELPPAHPDYYAYLSARGPILRAMVEADAVIVSTPPLAGYAREFNPNVFVVPNYLNDAWWRLRPYQERTGPLTLGYMGGHSHSYDLEVAEPALLNVLARYPQQVRLKFWGMAPPPAFRGLPNVTWVDVGLTGYRQFVDFFLQMECDLFIAPLQDNLFNRCKSHLKFLEYSALAVPGVYSRVAPYERVVVDGENGFLAGTLQEWEERLCALIEDPELRRQMGAAAQETVRRSWLLSDHLDEWEQTYRMAISAAEKHTPAGFTPAAEAARKMHAWQSELEARAAAYDQTLRELHDAQTQLASAQARAEKMFRLYLEILNSNSWRLMQRLFQVRNRVLPKGGKLETGLKSLLYSARILRSEGPGAFVRGVARRLSGALRGSSPVPHGVAQAPASDGWSKPVVIPGAMLPNPVVAVLVIHDHLIHDHRPPQVSEQAVREWACRQTFAASVELVSWDRQTGEVRSLQGEFPAWWAESVPELCQGLRARYLCLASPDLLGQGETYLEENLVALATEGLAFTLNTNGPADWLAGRLLAGELPGTPQQPLLRLVVDKTCLGEEFRLDLSTWLEGRSGSIDTAARIIDHLTREHDAPGSIPCDARLPELERHLQGKHLLVRARPDLPWQIAPRILHPYDTVLPAQPPVPDPRPTVLLLLQFLAVGGAEQLHLNLIKNLKDEIRFVVISIDEHDWALGTLADAFRQETPFVFGMPQFTDTNTKLSYLDSLIRRFEARSLYIGNGAGWIYDALGEIKKRHPGLRTVNQVYDHQIGWINRYDVDLAVHLDAHIGASQKICRAYVEKGVRPEQALHIEHGIDPSNLDPSAYTPDRLLEIRRSLGLPLDKKVVAFAARLHPQKRPMDYVELARRFASDPSVAFLFIGEGPLEGAVNGEIARLGLQNVYRRPFYRPISDVLAVMDVLVLPSEYEGMPLIVAESQIMGKPVVVTDVGNNREVLEATQGGVVVSQIGDITALMKGVRQMLDAPPAPQAIRQAFLENFGMDVIARKYKTALLEGTHA